MHFFERTVSFITKPLILLHLILMIQGGLFLWTTIHPYTMNTPNRTYLIVRGHLLYSSYIRQSKEGAWSMINPHTTRPSPRAYAHLFFVFLGKIAAIFNIDPIAMYMASRVIAAIVLFWSTYWFIRIILPKSLHALAILFILALEPGPVLNALTWNPAFWKASIFSYYPQVVAYRHFGLPHHTMGEAIGLLLLGMFILAVRKPTPKRLIALAILAVCDTIVLPPYPIILLLTVFAPWGLYSLLTRSWRRFVVPFAVAVLAIGAVGLFTKHELSKGYPWKDFNLDEKRWVTNPEVLINYLSTLVLYIPFIAFLWASALRLWKQWDHNLRTTIIIMTSWVILPPLLVPISSQPWFPLANFRLMDGYNFAPAGVLAVLGLSYVIVRIKKRALANFISGFLIMGIVVSSSFLTFLYTRQAFFEQTGLWSNVYLGNGHYKAFQFLNTVPKGSGVMVMNHFGEIIPDFASVRTFIGSTPGFVNWGELYSVATTFYTGQLTDSQAAELLKREDISYVYYSDEEVYYNTTGTLYPNLLTPVFELPGVTIYKVNK
jgi:hypothetical protein